jgi:phage tail protein X
MKRYQQQPISIDSQPLRYTTTKYPEISRDINDVYVNTTMGDRYDILAQTYYGDSSLWWIISSANPQYADASLFPPRGIQLRIPAPNRVANILGNYEALNRNEI